MSSVTIYYEPEACNCDGSTYSKSDIKAAATKALQLASQGKTEGKDKYPHAYNDYERFSFDHAQKPYLEFPIMQGKTYNGGSPGADRVVLGSIAEDYSSAVYCATITHDESKHNGFTECADEGESGGAPGVDERKLLERIDL